MAALIFASAHQLAVVAEDQVAALSEHSDHLEIHDHISFQGLDTSPCATFVDPKFVLLPEIHLDMITKWPYLL